jgi:hypothetical protein
VWTIGRENHDAGEFALAPAAYYTYRDDAYYVVGRSNPRTDWPYVLPGPADSWAGSRKHECAIAFGLKPPPTAECRLRLSLVDAQDTKPPKLAIRVNGTGFEAATERGAGDSSIQGDASAGRPQAIDVAFPAGLLHAGINEITISTVSGSWLVWDALSLDAPGAEVSDAELTRIAGVQSPPVLVKRLGRLNQIAEVTIARAGGAQDVAVSVGSHTVKASLHDGRQTVEVPIGEVAGRVNLPVSVTSANGAPVATGSLGVEPVRKWEVYLLPHSHVDIGYTALQSDVLKKQFSNLETAIDLARRTRDYPEGARFVWSAEVLWAVDAYLKQAPPAKRRALVDAVQRGWIELDALYGNELTALCRPEELFHLVEPAGRLARETGAPIHSAMITDVPGYAWGLIPVLAQSGVRYFSFGPNSGDRIGPTLNAWGDRPFRWETPAGDASVLCWMAGTGYSWFHGQTLAQKGDAELLDYLKSLEGKAYPYDMVQVRYTTNGDNGAPDPTLSDTVRDWNARYAYPKLVIATTTRMFRDFERRYGAKIPRVRGDFTPYWEDGAASTAAETAMNRAAAERLTQAEALQAMLRPGVPLTGAFEDAWRNVVLYDEHTWGAYNSISEPDSAFAKGQWAVKQKFALDADRQSRALLVSATGVSVHAAPNAVDVYNTSSWDRTDLVTIAPALSRAGDRVIGPGGAAAPSQRLSDGSLAFLARAVPAFGTQRYRILAGHPIGGKAAVTATALRVSGLAIAIDPATGAIVRVTTKWGNLARKLNAYLYVAGRDPGSPAPNGRPTITVKERGPLVVALQIRSSAPGANSLVREIRLVEGLDRVDITNTLDKQAIRTKEGVHFSFAFDVPNPTVRLDTAWAVVRPETDQMSGACKNWFTVQRWADVSNASSGITMATVDAPLLEIGGITAERPWMAHVAPSSTLVSYVMNNYWHTNYKADQSGPTEFRYALRPHGKYDAGGAARFGAEVSQPLVAVPAAGADANGSLVRIEPNSVLVTSLRPAADGKALLVRLYGASGRKESVRLRWSSPRKVSFCDPSGRPLKPVKGEVVVPAWGIVTLRAEPVTQRQLQKKRQLQ